MNEKAAYCASANTLRYTGILLLLPDFSRARRFPSMARSIAVSTRTVITKRRHAHESGRILKGMVNTSAKSVRRATAHLLPPIDVIDRLFSLFHHRRVALSGSVGIFYFVVWLATGIRGLVVQGVRWTSGLRVVDGWCLDLEGLVPGYPRVGLCILIDKVVVR